MKHVCIALSAEAACVPFLLFVKSGTSKQYSGMIHAYSKCTVAKWTSVAG